MTDPGPILVRTTRYACPHCNRTHSRPVRAREHIARCWYNPAARGCKTCKNFEPPKENLGEERCSVGVSLKGKPVCQTCVSSFTSWGCPDRDGTGRPVRPGPIVHCSRWEPLDDRS